MGLYLPSPRCLLATFIGLMSLDVSGLDPVFISSDISEVISSFISNISEVTSSSFISGYHSWCLINSQM